MKTHSEAHFQAVIAEALEGIELYRLVNLIDETLLNALERYLRDRIETGGFLRHILENDFMGAVRRMHPSMQLSTLTALTELLLMYFPATSYGSKEEVEAWLSSRPSEENPCEDVP